MSYLIFGIVVMIVTWWICKREKIKKYESEIRSLKNSINESFSKMVSQIMRYEETIEKLESELKTQKLKKEESLSWQSNH